MDIKAIKFLEKRWESAQELLDGFLNSAGELHPRKNDDCFCGSGRKYKICCYEDENKPFKPLDFEVKFIRDEESVTLEDTGDQSLFLEALDSLKRNRCDPSIESHLSYLVEKYPQHDILHAFLGIARKIFQGDMFYEIIRFKAIENRSSLAVKLFRWWRIFEWEPMIDFSKNGIETLRDLAPERDTFYWVEVALWGMILIHQAISRNRLTEAEEHFIKLVQLAALMNAPNHWVVSEAEAVLEKGRFVRRLKIIELNSKKRAYG